MNLMENRPPEGRESLEILREKAIDAIKRDTGIGVPLEREAINAVISWLSVAEEEANRLNTSVANIEVLIAQAYLLIEAVRPDLALPVVEEAREGVEFDPFFSREQIMALRALERSLREGVNKEG